MDDKVAEALKDVPHVFVSTRRTADETEELMNTEGYKGAPTKLSIGPHGEVRACRFDFDFPCLANEGHPESDYRDKTWAVLDPELKVWKCELCDNIVKPYVPFQNATYRQSYIFTTSNFHCRTAFFLIDEETCMICGKSYRHPDGYDSDNEEHVGKMSEKVTWIRASDFSGKWCYCTQNPACRKVAKTECMKANIITLQGELSEMKRRVSADDCDSDVESDDDEEQDKKRKRGK